MDEDTVKPLEEKIEAVVAEMPIVQDEIEEVEETQPAKEEQVPLSALKKERQRRQELELENKWWKEQQMKKAEPIPVEDDSHYESVTKGDLSNSEKEILRKVDERIWIKNNPERYEKINELLPEFLKRRPNLAAAIEAATNRYEEAWELMDKLSPKEQQKLKSVAAPKKDAPGSPNSLPKAAAMGQAVDVMSMDDAEFSKWRQAQRRR